MRRIKAIRYRYSCCHRVTEANNNNHNHHNRKSWPAKPNHESIQQGS